MDNYNKYNFEDFTIKHYRHILQIAKKKYVFFGYDNFEIDKKFAILRHDIDMSPNRALKIAKIEKEENIKATYFLHLHSEFYNLFEKEIFDIIMRIIDLDHYIGVHFDSHFYNIQSEDEINLHLENEKNILERLFNVKINVFSFHNTNTFIMSCKKDQYANLINVYSEFFQENFKYCSDSNGYWRYDRLLDVVQNQDHKYLHILTHPESWQDEAMSPWQRVERCIDGRAKKIKNYYNNLLRVNNRENIDWE